MDVFKVFSKKKSLKIYFIYFNKFKSKMIEKLGYFSEKFELKILSANIQQFEYSEEIF